MARTKQENTPSLLQYFAPPDDDLMGSFGWILGYSAGINFMNKAAETFTGKIDSRRRGAIHLALLLDKGHPQINIVNTPGVAHLLQKRMSTGFKLLHAKVALLHYTSKSDDNKWHIRLLISTGNWTSQTLSDSLDLITSVDLSSNNLKGKDEHDKQSQSDILAAWDFITYVRQFYQDGILRFKLESETVIRSVSFECLLDTIVKPRGFKSRFFDNRKRSLLQQLPGLIKRKTPRDLIYIASGFFQESTDEQSTPSTVLDIVEKLRESNLLSKNYSKYLVVNPASCQCVATAQKELRNAGWCIQKAVDPLERKRSLHAKFIFSGRKEGVFISKGWLYMGSGNITRPGFINRCSTNGGNLEAGIVLTAGKIGFRKGRHGKPDLSSILPVSPNDDELSSRELERGKPFDAERNPHLAAPVAFFIWNMSKGEGELIPGEVADIPYEVVLNGSAIRKNKAGNFIWTLASRPLTVQVRSNDQVVEVPVLDKYGNIAPQEPGILTINEVWSHLEQYPSDEGEADDDELEQKKGRGKNIDQRKNSNKTNSYPIRNFMEFLEKVANKQIQIRETYWKIWCNRLEQLLLQCDNDELEIFRKMELNPLSPLKQKAFVPNYAENKHTEYGRYYHAMLERVESQLNLKVLRNL